MDMSFNECKVVSVSKLILSSNTGLDAIKRAPIVNYNSGVRCLRIQDISQEKEFKDWGFCLVEDRNYIKFQLKKGDIIVARTGATIGVNRIIKEDLKSVFNNGLIRIKVNKEIVDNKYLYYNFQSEKYRGHINAISGGTSTQPNMKMNALLDFELILPSLLAQKKIASILSALDDKIERNNRMNKVLEQMAQAIFKQWFVEFEFPNENGEPYKSSGGEMEWCEELSSYIPNSWELGSLSEIVDIENKTVNPQKYKETLFEHYSLPAYDQNKTPVFEYGNEIKSNKFIVSKESILISKLNPTTKRVWNPFCRTGNSICSTEFMVYKSKNKKHFEYCYSVLNTNSFIEYLSQHVTGSTGSRQRVSPKESLNYPVMLMPTYITDSFVNMISPIYKKIQKNIIINEHFSATRDTLLPKLMSGEIDVSQVEL